MTWIMGNILTLGLSSGHHGWTCYQLELGASCQFSRILQNRQQTTDTDKDNRQQTQTQTTVAAECAINLSWELAGSLVEYCRTRDNRHTCCLFYRILKVPLVSQLGGSKISLIFSLGLKSKQSAVSNKNSWKGVWRNTELLIWWTTFKTSPW